MSFTVHRQKKKRSRLKEIKMYRKDLMLKIKTAVFGFVCAVSLTACTFNFNTDKTADPTPISAVSVNDLAEKVDNTDFKDDAQVDALSYEVQKWGKTIAVESPYLTEFVSARLVRVVDGDTIIVDIGGDEHSIRLIGINTPESVADEEYLKKTGKENTKEGKDASEYTKFLLNDVETVYLQKDVSETDKYDRLLRYVWLEIPVDFKDKREIESKMLNALLLETGTAEVTIYPPDKLYENEFKAIKENERSERPL